MKRFVIIFILLFLITPKTILAKNKVGIHIISENDLTDASNLVGEWGYITMVIREDERDPVRWQQVFNEMKQLKLIPIIRLATKTNNNYWEKPDISEAKNWAEFLNSLDWPTKDKYVILFNEPNHAKEWGGETNPAEYAQITRTYWEQLKRADFDFFVLPAGMDLAANNSSTTMDAEKYFDLMYQADELIFTIFDGWASHSYPNPNFSGNADDTGRMSIAGYKWELDYLNKYYLRDSTPVFITETGWTNSNSNLSEKYKYAFENVWNDEKIIAVTPFLLNYTSSPFDAFSWKNKKGNFLPHYGVVAGIANEN